MLRLSSILPALAVGSALVLSPVASDAQRSMERAPRFEITPLGGYQWGGSFDTDNFGSVPAGQLEQESSFSWGVILSYLTPENSAVELIYLRQSTDIRFDPIGGEVVGLGGFANNYIQLGGRWDLPIELPVRTFISASLGVNVLDPEADVGTETKFSWGVGGGIRYTFPDQRIGLRMDLKWLTTPVPSGDYGSWCDFYGCFVTEGTAWVNQGQATAGLVFAF